jgi:hypothetical protein
VCSSDLFIFTRLAVQSFRHIKSLKSLYADRLKNFKD